MNALLLALCTVGFVSACNPAQSSNVNTEPASEWPKLYRSNVTSSEVAPEFIWGECAIFNDSTAKFFMFWGGEVYPISGELFEAYVRDDGYTPKGVERSAGVERVEEARRVLGVIR